MSALNVKADFGAVGDGNTDDTDAIQAALDEAHGTADAPHGGSEGRYANRAVYFPNGWYITSRPLTLHEVAGAHIYGEGRLSTTIQNNTPDSSVFVTNGFMYSRFERLSLSLTGGGDGAAFDLNWDNTGTASLQSNTFADVNFGGGSYGLKIGFNGYMGSEISLLNCYLGDNTVAGVAIGNYNAIAITIVGGNIANCAKGIWVKHGGGMAIVGTGMQRNDIDIHIENGVRDGWDISGVRTESENIFLMAQPDSRIVVAGCTQTGGKYFLKDCGSDITLLNCYSGSGKIHGAGKLNLINSRSDNPDWMEWYGPIGREPSSTPVATATSDITLKAGQSGTVVTNFGASGDLTITLPVDTSTSYRIPAGTWFGFVVAADHELTVRAGMGWMLHIAGKASRKAGEARASRVGDYLEVMCVAEGGAAWIARSAIGSWTVN
jgi:hypothetical protein